MRYILNITAALCCLATLGFAIFAAMSVTRNSGLAIAVLVFLALLSVLALCAAFRYAGSPAQKGDAPLDEVLFLEFARIEKRTQCFFFKNTRLAKCLCISVWVALGLILSSALLCFVPEQELPFPASTAHVLLTFSTGLLFFAVICRIAIFMRRPVLDGSAVQGLIFIKKALDIQNKMEKQQLFSTDADGLLGADIAARLENGFARQMDMLRYGLQLISISKPELLPIFIAAMDAVEDMRDKAERGDKEVSPVLGALNAYLKGEGTPIATALELVWYADHDELSQRYLRLSSLRAS